MTCNGCLFMGGELNNAAYYFSPFGDVNDDTKMVCNGSFVPGTHGNIIIELK